MTTNKKSFGFAAYLNGVAVLLLAPALLLWLSMLVSRAGIQPGFPAACCSSMGGFGGLCFFFTFPILSFILSSAGIAAAKHAGKAALKWSLGIALASALLCAIAAVACTRT
jgi:hypothetical protein